VSIEDLTNRIELIRNKMISVGMDEGLTSPNTIKLSEKLDELINIKLSS
jgi:hypothetical protein